MVMRSIPPFDKLELLLPPSLFPKDLDPMISATITGLDYIRPRFHWQMQNLH
jgi:hypothetical protein